MILSSQNKGKSIYIGGLKRKPLRMLIRMGVVDSLGRARVCKSMEAAVHRAATIRKATGEIKGLVADCT